jgi:aspartyl-tRNA(Asn)/glutamyl-tRNA(Gln) amidotransferase subunit B
MLPDEVLELLTTSPKYNLTEKDAKILLSFDDGDRVEYYLNVVERADKLCKSDQEKKKLGKTAGNMFVAFSQWRISADIRRIIHELGALLTASQLDWTEDIVTAQQVADLIHLLLSGQITSNSAKKILTLVVDGDDSLIRDIASEESLLISEMGDEEYEQVIGHLLERHTDVVTAIKKKGQKGKIMWLVGQVMKEMGKEGKGGSIRPERVREVLEKMLA